MSTFKAFQKYYQQRDLAAKEWKGKGGKVVGYFCDNVPEEFILAAGFFPYRISGNPNSGMEKAEQFEQTFAFEGFVKTMLNMVLSGQYDFLDYLIIPHARASIHQLYPILAALKQDDPSQKFPPPYFLDNAHTIYLTSEIYNRDRMLAFTKELEKWSGREISNESMAGAIAVGNENKSLLKEVAQMRAADPPRISGVDALQIIGSSMFMLKEEHNRLLNTYLDEAKELEPREGARIFVESSPLDNLQFYELIESCDATVVAEDHCWGNRYSDGLVSSSITQMDAILDRYHFKSPCSRMYPMTRRTEYLLKNVLDARAEGVIFYIYANDAQAWEVPNQVKALKEKGIPSLYLKEQTYRISDPEGLKSTITKFVESL